MSQVPATDGDNPVLPHTKLPCEDDTSTTHTDEATCRAKFMKSWTDFERGRGRLPCKDHYIFERIVDPFALFLQVIAEGGIEKVVDTRVMSAVAVMLHFTDRGSSTLLKKYYYENLAEFEAFHMYNKVMPLARSKKRLNSALDFLVEQCDQASKRAAVTAPRPGNANTTRNAGKTCSTQRVAPLVVQSPRFPSAPVFPPTPVFTSMFRQINTTTLRGVDTLDAPDVFHPLVARTIPVVQSTIPVRGVDVLGLQSTTDPFFRTTLAPIRFPVTTDTVATLQVPATPIRFCAQSLQSVTNPSDANTLAPLRFPDTLHTTSVSTRTLAMLQVPTTALGVGALCIPSPIDPLVTRTIAPLSAFSHMEGALGNRPPTEKSIREDMAAAHLVEMAAQNKSHTDEIAKMKRTFAECVKYQAKRLAHSTRGVDI
jgi:hypothetical protein